MPMVWLARSTACQSGAGICNISSGEVERAIRRASDPMTRLHLQDVHLQIQRILDPRTAD